ncbi:hypothetical protein A2V54_02015 [candidate division WWE3 bacterium RBG_19FT_COMBO_53_11]|uniref:Uncharacterized protein n=1 Tax=candidate division WWE3 bacterium RBG_19FT_COMBO_53_11 TaxID=1802613 RepID=A0A1F4UHX3_UNCKA|nr:MAG: hypothetical protein A2V54_02015 [candidate division WWE3 bacterium RBG_19FT_COMBO_53_11]
MFYINWKKNGYVMLVSVLVIGAIGVAVGVSLILLGLSASRTSFSLEQSNQTKALANACAEKALQQIKDLPSFSGTNNLALGQGNCTYTVIAGSGENRTIEASGNVDTIIRRVKITIDQINPTINIISWQEVSEF